MKSSGVRAGGIKPSPQAHASVESTTEEMPDMAWQLYDCVSHKGHTYPFRMISEYQEDKQIHV